jgi:hypothetical protein
LQLEPALHLKPEPQAAAKPVCADQRLRPDTGGTRWGVWNALQKAPLHNSPCTFPGALVGAHRGRFCGTEGGTRRSSQARTILQALTAFSTKGKGGQARATRHAHSTVTKPAEKAMQRGWQEKGLLGDHRDFISRPDSK